MRFLKNREISKDLLNHFFEICVIKKAYHMFLRALLLFLDPSDKDLVFNGLTRSIVPGD